MKSKLQLCLLLMISIKTTIAQTIAIPDSNFEQALIEAGQDSDGTVNGLILQSDAEAINTLALNNKGINSLQGIEGFINVTSLVCSNNNLTSINFSSNAALQTLDCSNNNLTSLDISNNTSLTSLIAINSQLTSLDVSNNTLLTYLSAPFNQLTSLNVGNNTVLETMYVHSNELTSLDVSNLSLLQTLYCYSNDITSLNVSNATALEYLQCYGNLFTSLNVNTNTNLKELRCSDGELVSIDVSNNTLLEDFRVWGNQLASLDLSNNPALTIFSCANNNLTSLNLKNGNNTILPSISTTNNSNLACIDVDNVAYSNANWTNIDAQTSFSEDCNSSAPTIAIPDDNFETALIDLGIDTNGFTGDILQSDAEAITSLNVNNKAITSLVGIEGFVNLTVLNCNNNNLSSLNVSNNLNLQQIDCTYNQITDLALGNNTALFELFAFSNQLTALNIESNSALSTVFIQNNLIIEFDASNNIQLTELNLVDNQLNSLNVKNGNNLNIIGVFAENNSNLFCIEVDDVAYSTSNWSTYIDPQTNFSEDCSVPFPAITIPDANFEQALIDLGYDTNGLTGNILQIDAEAVTSLIVNNKNISSLQGIEGFINVTTIYCDSNQLTSLDISNNILLDTLSCSYNQLTSLDVSNNTNLDALACDGNQLTNLDLSEINGLETLSLTSNQLINIDVNNHISLNALNVASNQLTSLNVKNTNNSSFSFFDARNNPNLFCINVDDATYSTTNWIDIDTQASFSEDCGYYSPTIAIPDANFEQALIDLGYDTNGFTGNILQSDAENVTSLDVHGKDISNFTGIGSFINLIELDFRFNNIDELNGIENLISLERLIGYNNPLTIINVTTNAALKELSIGNNTLANIDVSNNPLLEELYCYNCQLSNIDLSSNPNLIYLELGENELTSLDINSNLAIEYLSFHANQITSIDLSNHTALLEVYVYDNQLTNFNIKNGNNTIITDFEADGNPDLFCIEVDSAPYSTALWSNYIDAQATFSEDCSTLGVDEVSLTDTLSLYPNPTSEVFYIKGLQEDTQVTIYDINGRAILAATISSNQSVNVSQIPSGIYLVNIKNNSGETVKKLAVK